MILLFYIMRGVIMISLDVLYPYSSQGKFDSAYYAEKHVPLIKSTLGDLLEDVTYEQGISGPVPGSDPAFFCMAHLFFKSLNEFSEATTKFPILLGDVPNYTDVQPIMQISEEIH